MHPNQNPSWFLKVHMNQADSKVYMERQGTRIARTLKKKWVGSFTLLDFKIDSKATGIKTISYWQVNRHMEDGKE